MAKKKGNGKKKPSKKDQALMDWVKLQGKKDSRKKHFTKEYYVSLVKTTMSNIDWDIKCKPHIQSLPYDRRNGRTSDELFERYQSCLEGMRKTRDKLDDLRKQSSEALDEYRKFQHEKEDLVEQYKSMRADNQEFFDAESKVLDDRNRVLDNIKDTINMDVVIPENLRERIEGLGKYFNSGWINQGNKTIFDDLAGDIIDWRYSREQDDTPWAKTVDGIADDIRILGDNSFFDSNLPKLYENTHDEGEFANLIDLINESQKGMDDASSRGDAIHKDLKKQERIFTDYHIESEKTKLSYVKTGVLDNEVSPEKKATWIKNQEANIKQMEEELY